MDTKKIFTEKKRMVMRFFSYLRAVFECTEIKDFFQLRIESNSCKTPLRHPKRNNQQKQGHPRSFFPNNRIFFTTKPSGIKNRPAFFHFRGLYQKSKGCDSHAPAMTVRTESEKVIKNIKERKVLCSKLRRQTKEKQPRWSFPARSQS